MSDKVRIQNNDIIVADEIKVYNIKSTKGKMLGKFAFNPGDSAIAKRYDEVVDYFNNLNINDDTDIWQLEDEIVEKISYIVGADAKDTFFSIMGALSILESGDFFFINVLTAISKVIEKEMSIRTKKVQRRMNKYVAKYHK